MSLFGLDPKSVVARTRNSVLLHIPSLKESLLVGSLGFGLVSLVGFATVAFGEHWLFAHLGRLGSYIFWALLFALGAGAVFNRLVIGGGNLVRSFATFAAAFLIYAATWTAAYFILSGQSGEWIGSISGSVLMGLFLCGAFSALNSSVRAIPTLLAGNLAGYFLGRTVWSFVPGPAGMIGWGIIYGLGFGAGLGYALYVCQEKVRAELAKESPLSQIT